MDLRYDNQIIVNPEMQRSAKAAPALSPAVARAAAAAGVKPAALVTRLSPHDLSPHDRTVPKPAFELTEKKLDPKVGVAGNQEGGQNQGQQDCGEDGENTKHEADDAGKEAKGRLRRRKMLRRARRAQRVALDMALTTGTACSGHETCSGKLPEADDEIFRQGRSEAESGNR